MISPLGFKARMCCDLVAFAETNVHSLRSTSGAIPAYLLTAGMVASSFSYCYTISLNLFDLDVSYQESVAYNFKQNRGKIGLKLH